MTDVYTYLGYTKVFLETLANSLPRFYITYKIQKRNGKSRRIDAPQDPLKAVQTSILNKILYLFRAHPMAHGFVKDRSPITNAKVHLGKKYIMTIDIKNFFNSIQEGTVERCLLWLFSQQTRFTYDPDDCILLAKLLCYNGGLPQGSPASPVMSNLVCLSLDKRLSALSATHDATITRYADDITISSDNAQVFDLKNEIYSHIIGYGLIPNKKKTKLRRYFQRQQVTGIIVNKKLSVKKENWKNLRAKLHNLLRDKKSFTPEEAREIRGYLEWIRSLNPHRGDQMIKKFSMINVKP